MRILYIAQWAGAEKYGMVYGHYYLAREWAKKGHDVTIMSGSYSHTRFEQPITNKYTVSEEYIDGIRYLWIPVNSYPPTSNLGRVCAMFIFSIRAFFYHSNKNYDAVISSSHHPFSIFAAKFHAWRSHSKLIFEVRDLWPASLIYLAGMNESHPLIKLMAWSEAYAYRNVDQIVTTLEKSLDYMASKGLNNQKFNYLPNGMETTNNHAPTELPNTFSSLLDPNIFTVIYCGNIGVANNLSSLVSAGEILNRNQYQILIIGDGPELDLLMSQTSPKSCVQFHARVDKTLIPSILDKADLTYISYQYSPLYEYGVSPTKLGDYAAAKKPILFSADFNLGEIEDQEFLIRCADTAEDIANEIQSVASKPVKVRENLGADAHRWVQENRNYTLLADRYLKLINNKM